MGFTAAKANDGILPSPEYGRVQKHFKLVNKVALLSCFSHLKKLSATSYSAHVMWAQGYGNAVTVLGTHLEAADSSREVENINLSTSRFNGSCNEFVEASPLRQQRKLPTANRRHSSPCQVESVEEHRSCSNLAYFLYFQRDHAN